MERVDNLDLLGTVRNKKLRKLSNTLTSLILILLESYARSAAGFFFFNSLFIYLFIFNFFGTLKCYNLFNVVVCS